MYEIVLNLHMKCQTGWCCAKPDHSELEHVESNQGLHHQIIMWRHTWEHSVNKVNGQSDFFVWHHLCWGADKSLARPTFWYHRAESIVSLEGGVCSRTELQFFSCYGGWKEACQATRAISTTSRHELSSSFFFLQGKAPKEIYTILTETLGEHAPLYAAVKNWVAQFKCDFSTCDVPHP